MTKLAELINIKKHPIEDPAYRQQCRQQLIEQGTLVLPNFLTAKTLRRIKREGSRKQMHAYYTQDSHNVYLRESDPQYTDGHARNRLVESSKGCITDDQIDTLSPLRSLYDSLQLRSFFCDVLEEQQLYNYADRLSSINLHYASEGQELGWHFDNSSFAITLLIQKPAAGGVFEYVKDLLDADSGEMNYEQVSALLDGEITPMTLSADEGSLVLFRGRNAIHRVTPTQGDITRMLVVLAYNSQPDIALSESARMTFYGRL